LEPLGCFFAASTSDIAFPPASSIFAIAPALKVKAAIVTLCASRPDAKTFPGITAVSFDFVCREIRLRFTAARERLDFNKRSATRSQIRAFSFRAVRFSVTTVSIRCSLLGCRRMVMPPS
jgi:hypothetical protein